MPFCLHGFRPQRLHRVDDDQGGRGRARERRDDVGEIGLRAEGDGRLGKSKPGGAHPDLRRRFLAGKIHDAGAGTG